MMVESKTILFAEAETDGLKEIIDKLENNGFQVVVATDGLEALSKVVTSKPNLIIVAAMLPKLHGFQVCKTIKKMKDNQSIPVIIVSGSYKSQLYRHQAMTEYLADEFLFKPIDSDNLFSIIQQHLKGINSIDEKAKVSLDGADTSKLQVEGGIENLLEKTLASLMDFDEVGSNSLSVNEKDVSLKFNLEDTLYDLMQIKDDEQPEFVPSDESIEKEEKNEQIKEEIVEKVESKPVDFVKKKAEQKPKKKKSKKSSSNKSKTKKSGKISSKQDTSKQEKKVKNSSDIRKAALSSVSTKRSNRNLLSEVDEDEIDRIVDEALMFDELEEDNDEELLLSKSIASDALDAQEEKHHEEVFKSLKEEISNKNDIEEEDDPLADFFFEAEVKDLQKTSEKDVNVDDNGDRGHDVEDPFLEISQESDVENSETPFSISDDDASQTFNNEQEEIFPIKETNNNETWASTPKVDDNLSVSDETDEEPVFDDEELLSLVSENLRNKNEMEDIEPDIEEKPFDVSPPELNEIKDNADDEIPAAAISEDEAFLAALENLEDEGDTDTEQTEEDVYKDKDIEESREYDEQEEYGMAFGKYILIEKIATGGMAEIFKAKQRGVEGFEKLVVIKRILPHLSDNKEFVSMFIDEGKIAAQLTHQNIAQIYELGEEKGYYYIAMEYVQGKDLRTLLQKSKERNFPLSMEHAVLIISKLCSGLDYAHRKKDFDNRDLNIVHRDISPQNVLISYEGEVKIIDFGIAKAAAKDHHTRAGALKGKILYMSPEQAWGKSIDKRSDIFSLGTLLYEMLTQKRLFLAQSEIQILQKVREAKIIPPRELRPEISEKLETIILKALAKDPDQRYQVAGEMQRDLDYFLYSRELKRSTFDLTTYMHSLFKSELIGEIPESAERFQEIENLNQQEKQYSEPVIEEDTVATRQDYNQNRDDNEVEDEIDRLLSDMNDKSSFLTIITHPIVIIVLVVIILLLVYFVLWIPLSSSPSPANGPAVSLIPFLNSIFDVLT